MNMIDKDKSDYDVIFHYCVLIKMLKKYLVFENIFFSFCSVYRLYIRTNSFAGRGRKGPETNFYWDPNSLLMALGVSSNERFPVTRKKLKTKFSPVMSQI